MIVYTIELTFLLIGIALGAALRASAMRTAAQLRDLLARARYDLERHWPEAAYDVLCRAQRLIPDQEHSHD